VSSSRVGHRGEPITPGQQFSTAFKPALVNSLDALKLVGQDRDAAAPVLNSSGVELVGGDGSKLVLQGFDPAFDLTDAVGHGYDSNRVTRLVEPFDPTEAL
jgi:hypothetical protein